MESSADSTSPGIVITEDEIIHHGPLAIRQNYSQYTNENHGVWSLLYARQFHNLQDIAYSKWLSAIEDIGLSPLHIPRLTTIGTKLDTLTKWLPVPISGFLTAKDYFSYIANRQFPTVTTLRSLKEIDFIVEPDLFHDAFGHLPMHADPAFADFIQLYGKIAYQLTDDHHTLQMSRLYWYTVEYGLIREHGKIKIAGSGHMSGLKESRYSLTDKVEKVAFKLEDVVNQDFNPHVLQEKLFVMESFEQLSDALIVKAKEFGVRT